MSSAIYFDSDQSKILSSGYWLKLGFVCGNGEEAFECSTISNQAEVV